jgi:hypothetical protein
MRVILKPAGLICLVGAFAVLATVALWKKDAAAPTVGAPGAAASSSPSAPSTAPGRPLPAGVLLTPDIASDNWKPLITTGKSSSSVVDATVPGHPRARRIVVEEAGANPWDVQFAHPLDAPFRKGDRLRLTYWARSKDSCPMTTAVEQSAEPYDKIVYKQEQLTPEWKQYTEEWEQQSDTPPGWAKVDFQVGAKAGEIEITGVILRRAG